MTKAIVFASAVLLGMAAQAADQPARNGKSDIKKGNAAAKKKEKSTSTSRGRTGVDAQGTQAQGAARE